MITAYRGQMTVVVEQQMKLDRSLGPLEPGPVEHRGAEIDGGRIEREQRAAEPELVPRGDGLATRIQTLKTSRYSSHGR